MTSNESAPALVAPPSRWPRRAAYGAAGLAVLLPTGAAGASWFMASQVLNVDSARRYPVRVRSVTGDQVALTRTVDTARSIPLSLVWYDGHAQLGDVVAVDRANVVRDLVTVTRGTLSAGVRGYTSSYVFEGDPSARGLAFTDVMVPSELGDLPAWFVPPVTAAASDVWVVAVHGRAAPRGEALRVLPALAASGHPTLVVSYRNDVGAPPSPDRRYHLGDTEWQDVVSALRYAREQGAAGVVLYGWSMGGATVLTLLRRWAHDGFVRGAVLDCPVVDWTATLQLNARQMGAPPAWTWAALRLVEHRLRVRLSELDHRRFADSLDVPMLVFVDHDDATVAPSPTLDLAYSRPDLVTLVETRGAGHCRSWNAERAAYETALASFLAAVG
jgi:alpha-beta hydrolase superfamily lysophospholipase